MNHLDRVRELPCCICGDPSQAHHARGGSMADRGIHAGIAQKNSDYLAIPLCEYHHTGAAGIHTVGVRGWEAAFGLQAAHIDRTAKLLEMDLWALAAKPVKRKPYKPSSKIVPRAA